MLCMSMCICLRGRCVLAHRNLVLQAYLRSLRTTRYYYYYY